MVQLVVEVFVDLARSAVLDQEAAEDSEATHPQDLPVETRRISLIPRPSKKQASALATVFPHRSKTHEGILASAVPFLFPNPRCLPILRAAVNSLARARECIVTCLRMMRPSETSLRTVWRELAFEISFTSLGSSQILRLPQPTTEAARRF